MPRSTTFAGVLACSSTFLTTQHYITEKPPDNPIRANIRTVRSPDRTANTPPLLHSTAPPGLSARDVFSAYDRDDATAGAVITQAVEFWGMAVANLVSLFNPEKIIFGGGVFGPAAPLLGDIYAEGRKWAQPISIKQVKLQASKLGGDAGLYGAGCLALQAHTSSS
jgi:predicted NBD/HSP70 family sugar kinase